MNFIYPAIFHKTETGRFTAVFPDLEMCRADGDTLEDCIENANSAAYDWIYVELSEFDGQLPAVTDITDIPLKDGDIVRNISVHVRLTDGWDE